MRLNFSFLFRVIIFRWSSSNRSFRSKPLQKQNWSRRLNIVSAVASGNFKNYFLSLNVYVFSSVKSRLTLNYLMHAWLEIANAYREARGLYGTLRFLRMIMINDSIMLISSRTLLRSTSARLVPLVLEDFFFLSTKKASSCKRENFFFRGNTVSSYHIREGWPVISLTRTNF